jgi:L-aspartate oxidase
VHERFPLIAETCGRAGLDLGRDPIPVGPAAHYMMGGVQTDLDGRTSVAGLFAAGEVACTGVHGANRLASNSLLEGLVFGARAGEAMALALESARLRLSRDGQATSSGAAPRRSAPESTAREGGRGPLTTEDIQSLMWRNVGLFRDREAGRRARAAGSAWKVDEDQCRDGVAFDDERWRRASILTVGMLIARAALRREESRGGHYRTDFPKRDDINWKRRVPERRDG